MKEKYEEPVLDIIVFEDSDVICASGDGDNEVVFPGSTTSEGF